LASEEQALQVPGGPPAAWLVTSFFTEAQLRQANPEPVNDSVGLIWWPPDFHSARCLVKNGCVWNEGAVFNVSKEPDWIPCGIPYRSLMPKAAECTHLLSPPFPSSS
jgi:hypothetical protein